MCNNEWLVEPVEAGEPVSATAKGRILGSATFCIRSCEVGGGDDNDEICIVLYYTGYFFLVRP